MRTRSDTRERMLDAVLPRYDWAERYERTVPAAPAVSVAAMLDARVASDPLVRVLLRARGLRVHGSLRELFGELGLDPLHESATEVVLGASGTPWRLRSKVRPFADARLGDVRIAVDVRGESAEAGCVLSTETRIEALDDEARRAFARYWRVVRPFSGVVRRRWLAAAAHALAQQ